MKKLILFLLLLFLCGCASPGGYEEGYSAGYDAGYKAALETRSVPDVMPAPTDAPTSTPRPTSTPKPSSKPTPMPTLAPTPAPTQASDDITVYVSRSFKIHKKSSCSGMTVYTEMTLSQAESFGYEKCKKCWK